LTFANVTNYWKWYAHCGIAMIYFSYIIYTITRESIFYINLRQAYLMSPFYANRISSRTVLFTSVPKEYMNEGKLHALFGAGVRRIWFASNTKDLEDKVQQRDKAAMKLEAAETKLIVSANKARLKAEKKGQGQRTASEEAAIGEGSIAMRYLKPKERPTHRLKMLIGKKVDSIDWCRAELKKLIPEVDKMQATEKAGDGKLLNSVFIEFSSLIEAQAAYQALAHHQALHMSPRFAGINPGEVIWSNLRLLWWERVIRRLATTAFVVALIIFWSIPVAAVGAISNISQLEGTSAFHWLHYILDPIPSVIMGVVTGLLPTILLAVLMALLPIILRAMAKWGGDPTASAVELTVQNTYFAFQVIQVFLVATLGSAASSVGAKIAKSPSRSVKHPHRKSHGNFETC
jgi:calcium permeable stress-gated cation channel